MSAPTRHFVEMGIATTVPTVADAALPRRVASAERAPGAHDLLGVLANERAV